MLFVKRQDLFNIFLFFEEWLFSSTNFELLFLKYNNHSLDPRVFTGLAYTFFTKFWPVKLIHTTWGTFVFSVGGLFFYSEVKFKEVAGFIHFFLMFIVLIFIT